MTREEFLSMALLHLAKKGISVSLHGQPRVDGCSGFYCHNDKTLKVATGKPFAVWFLVFIHEYCHFLQGLDSNHSSRFPYQDYYWTRYYAWLEKKRKCTPRTIAKYIHGIREVELDCERRVIRLIKKHNLPIDIGEYIQKSNAYALFYSLTKETRKWYGESSPHEYAGAWKLLPTTFMEDYDDVPEDFRKVVLAKCF